MKKLILFFALTACITQAYSQAGKPDSTFGGKGYINTLSAPVNSYQERGKQVFQQADGKLLAYIEGTVTGTSLARFNTNGSLDVSYGTNGYSAIMTGSLALQSDGKMLSTQGAYIQRLNKDGSPDNSFGKGGLLTINPGAFFYANSLAIQPDGKIVVAGFFYINSTSYTKHLALMRYNPDGTADQGFGSSGEVVTMIAGNDASELKCVAIRSDGKIIAAGYTTNSNNYMPKILLAEYNADGTPDNYFGTSGIMRTTLVPGPYNETELVLQPDGRVLVGGTAAFSRYNTNGSIDNSFGYMGTVGADVSPLNTITIQADGKIVAGGPHYTGYNRYTGQSFYNFGVVRYNPDGSRDNSFGTAGNVNFMNPGSVTTLNSLVVQADGEIVALGTVDNNYVYNGSDYGLARITPNGTLDNSFNSGGIVVAFFPASFTGLRAVAVQPDGKIVAAGYGSLYRFNPDGSADNTFSGDGMTNTSYGSQYAGVILLIQPDGKILLAAESGNFTLVRYNKDGSIDSTFNSNGTVITQINSAGSKITALALQPDGKILAAGTAYSPGSSYTSSAVVRYNTNGSPDNSFNGNGIVVTPLAVDNHHGDDIGSVAVQPNGKIVLAGSAFDGSNITFALVRYNTDGSLDATLDGDGKLYTYFPGFTSSVGLITIDPDGKLVAAGTGSNGTNKYVMLARYNANGSTDNSFGNGGKLISDSVFSGVTTIIRSNGKFIVSSSLSVDRFNANGSADNGFGYHGRVMIPFRGYSYQVYSIDTSGNRLYTAGSISPSGNVFYDSQGLLAAYLLEDATPAFNGLKYSYYERSWDQLPDFSTLTAMKTGTSANVDIAVRPPGKDDNFAFKWEGFINIPAAGTYTFETVSDDGSKLYFNIPYAATAPATVNNDGLHGAVAATGTVTVAAPGRYPIVITYFEKTALEAIQVYWSGPGLTRQLIPDAAFTDSYQPGDNITPSAPANLKATGTGHTFINLAWSSSTDNTGVTGYDVYVNGSKKYTTAGTTVKADSLAPDMEYSFRIKAFDLAGNYSAFSDSIKVTTGTDGLKYRYYEGEWETLPDFSTLTPVKTGTSANADISVRPAGKVSNYGFVWEGYINIKTPGDYTFETTSDDGSKFYFNSFYTPAATALVNNDGQHGLVTVKGTVHVDTAGLYPVAITFFQRSLDASIQLFWTGPGITRQVIPDIAFTDGSHIPADTIPPSAPTGLKSTYTGRTFVELAWNSSTDNVGVAGYDVYVNGIRKYATGNTSIKADSLTAGVEYSFYVKAFDLAGNYSAPGESIQVVTSASGLKYRYYEGSWLVLPDFTTLTPVKTGTSANADISVRPAGVNSHYGFIWEGYINIKTPGDYTFETMSDDGSKFYFNRFYSPGAVALVNNDGQHGLITVKGTVHIDAAGLYPVTITFFQQSLDASIQLYWSGPGISRQVIPDAAFTENYTGSAVAGADAGLQQAAQDVAPAIKIYPNPFTDRINITINNTVSQGRAGIDVFDLYGKKVFAQTFGKLPAGLNNLKADLKGTTLPAGWYTIRLNINGVAAEVFKLVKTGR